MGGIYGFESLRQVLGSPGAAGHQEALDWLGLERSADFDADAFSVSDANHSVTRALVATWI